MDKFQFKGDGSQDLESIEIVGNQISLVSINKNFADSIYEEFDESITRYMIPEPAKDINETYLFISNSVDGMRNRNELVLAIVDSSGDFLGCCGLHGRGKCRTPELGIWLKKSAHGKKYGQTAIRSLLNWAAKNIDFDYAIYPVDKSNVASRKIPELLGGVIYKEAKVKTWSGQMLDEVVYKIEA